MRVSILLFLCCVIPCFGQEDALPKDPGMRDFQILLRKSALVIDKKAPVVSRPPVNNNFYLRGVAKFEEGWMVTLADRTKPKERIFLEEGKPTNKKGLRLVRVLPDKESYKNTTAVIMHQGLQLTVEYDNNAIKNNLAKANRQSKVSPKPNNPAQPPQNQATQPNANGMPQNQRPRTRPLRVRPATNSQTQQNQ